MIEQNIKHIKYKHTNINIYSNIMQGSIVSALRHRIMLNNVFFFFYWQSSHPVTKDASHPMQKYHIGRQQSQYIIASKTFVPIIAMSKPCKVVDPLQVRTTVTKKKKTQYEISLADRLFNESHFPRTIIYNIILEYYGHLCKCKPITSHPDAGGTGKQGAVGVHQHLTRLNLIYNVYYLIQSHEYK